MWQDNDMELAVHYAARNPVVDVIAHILQVGGAKRLLNAKDIHDRQPIHHAAVFNENKEVLQYILKVGGPRRFSRIGWKRSSPSRWCARLEGLAEYCGDETATPDGVPRSRVGLIVAVHPGGASKVKLQWLSDGIRSQWLPVAQLFEPTVSDAGGAE
jgi:ankyrin repeat protein